MHYNAFLHLWHPQPSAVTKEVTGVEEPPAWCRIQCHMLPSQMDYCGLFAVVCPRQGELNGHKGLVPSNFLEEVPDDVEVYLTDSPSRYVQDTPARIKTKRVHAPSQY